MASSTWREFEQYTCDLMEQDHIAGVAVAVSQGGQIIYQNGFGLRNLEAQAPVTPDTIFGIASVTKSFTAVAIMQLEDAGKLSVDDPVVKYLPEFTLHGVNDISQIRIRHLLSHTTGVPPLRRREELNQLDDHLSYLAADGYDLLGSPGEYFSYCNDTFLLLGAIIERLTGRLFRRYVTERILSPLKMYRSTLSIEELKKFQNVSVPYLFDRISNQFQVQEWPALGNYEVGGGIRSNVLDLVKYGHVYLDVGNSTGQLRVTRERLQQMRQPVHRIGRDEFYGYALRIAPNYHDVTLVEHGGKQPGVSSQFGFVPEAELVVAVLTNVSNAPVDDIWLAAVHTALAIPIKHRGINQATDPPTREQCQHFSGTYTCAEGATINIYRADDRLKAALDENQFALWMADERTLVMEKSNKTIQFFYNEDDPKPWAAFHGLRMLRRVDG